MPIQVQSEAPPLDQVELPAKYKYPIFEGFSGERYLKSLLRKILPLSLYATWDILVVDFQARGNDAYLSVSRLAEARERTERKIRLDLAELKARKLLCYRLTPKAFRQRDGSTKTKTVVVKDFDALYDLAYEYHVWCESEYHIEADRDLMDAIKQNDLLCRKLLRFDNYRRLLCNQVPGRKAQAKEAHRWYTEYACGDQEEDVSAMAAPISATNAPSLNEERACSADEQKSSILRNFSMQKDMQKEVQEDSQERIKTSDYSHRLYEGDSFDSEECFKCRSEFPCPTHVCNQKQGTITENDTNTNLPTHETSPTPPTTNQETKRSPQCADEAARPARRESIEQNAMIEEARRVMALVGTPPNSKGRRTFTATVPAKQAPRPHSLTTSFLHEIGGPFCDKNKKASNTQALRLIQDVSCEQPYDAVKLLVRSYVSASTATVKLEHRHPDGDNRMPLFFFFLRTFMKAWNDNAFHYTDEQLFADISQDERLLLWFSEHAHSLQGAGETRSTSPDRQPDDEPSASTQEAAETGHEETAAPGPSQRRSQSKRSMCAEDRNKREQLAQNLKWKLNAAGVPQVSVGLEHRCGCPLYWQCSGKDRCVHCEGDSTWNETILALIASVFEQS